MLFYRLEGESSGYNTIDLTHTQDKEVSSSTVDKVEYLYITPGM